MKLLVIVLVAFCAGPISLASQLKTEEQLRLAFDFQKQGHYDRVVELLSPIVQSGNLPTTLEGQTLTVLGFAYEALGKFNQAQTSYEQAILLLAHDGQGSDDYALASMNFANLLGEEGRVTDAANLDKRAVQAFSSNGNWAGLARAYAALASRELSQSHLRTCSRYLLLSQNASTEFSDKLDDDFRAELAAIQARLSETRGDRQAAIQEYKQALDWRLKLYGEHHMATGWTYVQLGEAESKAGENFPAIRMLDKGLAILEETLGKDNPKYLRAEIIYSSALKNLGCKEQASRLSSVATKELAAISHRECIGCRQSAAAFH
jgi:tetratricopeptide (TPR) repeat protein